jgi:hypothetical protein
VTPEPDPETYLEAFRREHDPGPDAAAAALARVQARVAAGDGGADDAAPVVETGLRTSNKVLVAALALAAAVALALQLDVGGWIARRGEPDGSDHAAAYAGGGASEGADATRVSPVRSSADPETRQVAPTPLEDEREAETETETQDVIDEAVDELEAVDPEVTAQTGDVRPASPARPRSTAAPEPTAPGSDATLLAELSLLESAQAALSAGNAARALQQLDRHAKSFPGSMLAEERDVARIEALCRLGRASKVRAAKRRFARSFPGSPLSGRAKSACPEASP